MRRLLFALAFAACAAPKPRSPPTAAEVVQRQLDAYNARDFEAFVATYADDILITSGDGQVVVLGKQGLRDRFEKSFKAFPKARARIAERKLDRDTVVIDHEIITGRPDKPDPWDVGWVRYEVRGGLIHSVQHL